MSTLGTLGRLKLAIADTVPDSVKYTVGGVCPRIRAKANMSMEAYLEAIDMFHKAGENAADRSISKVSEMVEDAMYMEEQDAKHG